MRKPAETEISGKDLAKKKGVVNMRKRSRFNKVGGAQKPPKGGGKRASRFRFDRKRRCLTASRYTDL